MHIKDVDLNLLRIFDAVYSARSVSRAAERLGLSQPAVSHGVTRLRLLLKDPLFVRVGGGVAPTAKADQLADTVQQAMQLVEQALQASEVFDPRQSRRTFRLHMSDIGEGVFLPVLLPAIRRLAPSVRIETQQLDDAQILSALETGRIDLAFGYLPGVTGTQQQPLLNERYVVLTRRDHPLAHEAPTREMLGRLDYVVVQSHSETGRLLQRLGINDRIRLTIPHFMVIPAIISETDLAVVLPQRTAASFARSGALQFLEPDFALPSFVVSLHWCRRFHNDPAIRWLRALAIELSGELPVNESAAS